MKTQEKNYLKISFFTFLQFTCSFLTVYYVYVLKMSDDEAYIIYIV